MSGSPSIVKRAFDMSSLTGGIRRSVSSQQVSKQAMETNSPLEGEPSTLQRPSSSHRSLGKAASSLSLAAMASGASSLANYVTSPSKNNSSSALTRLSPLRDAHDMKHSKSETDLNEDEKEQVMRISEAAQLQIRYLSQGRKKFLTDPKEGMAYFISNKIVEETPQSVAQFLYNSDFLSRKSIGDYLGEGKPFCIEVLKEYVACHDFIGMEFDQALRKFLCKFRLPGEAQKIDRMMEQFARRFTEQCPNTFANADTAYVLAFSTIMLNTDLHNPSVKRKMSKADFINNNRGINGGQNLPERFLSNLYDAIQQKPFSLASSSNTGDNEEGEAAEAMDAAFTFGQSEKEGFLIKQGGRIKTWKRRYCIVANMCLYYFKKPEDREPCGIIPLENLSVQIMDNASRKFLFSLVPSDDSNPEDGNHSGQGSLTDISTASNATTASNQTLSTFPTLIKAAKTDNSMLGSAMLTSGSSKSGRFVAGHHSTYVFQCTSAEERDEWISCLRSKMAVSPIYELLRKRRQQQEIFASGHAVVPAEVDQDSDATDDDIDKE